MNVELEQGKIGPKRGKRGQYREISGVLGFFLDFPTRHMLLHYHATCYAYWTIYAEFTPGHGKEKIPQVS